MNEAKINYTLEMIGGYDEKGILLDVNGKPITNAANIAKFPDTNTGKLMDCIGFDDATVLRDAGKLSGIEQYQDGFYSVRDVMTAYGKDPNFKTGQASALEAVIGTGERFVPFKHEQDGRTVYFLGLDITKADVTRDYLGNDDSLNSTIADSINNVLESRMSRYILQREEDAWQKRLAKGSSEKNDRKYLKNRGVNTESIDVKKFSFAALDDERDYERINAVVQALQSNLPDRYQVYTDEFIAKVYFDLKQATDSWVSAFHAAADEILAAAAGERNDLVNAEKHAILRRTEGIEEKAGDANARRSHIVRLRNDVYQNERELSIHSGGFDYDAGSRRALATSRKVLEKLIDNDRSVNFSDEDVKATGDIEDEKAYVREGSIVGNQEEDRYYTRTPKEINADSGVAQIFEILGDKLKDAATARGLRSTTIFIEPALDAMKAQLVYTGIIIQDWARKQYDAKAELIYGMLDAIDEKIAKYESRSENVLKGIDKKEKALTPSEAKDEAAKVRNGLNSSYWRKEGLAVQGLGYQFKVIGVANKATRTRMLKKANIGLSAERQERLRRLEEIIARGAPDGN